MKSVRQALKTGTKPGRIFLVFLVSVLGSTCGLAQYPVAAGAPTGIYVFLDNSLPKEGYFEVLRSPADRNSFQSLGKVTAPSGEDELAGRISKYEAVFPDLGHYSQKDIDRMWNYLQMNSSLDTLAPVNYPVMLLAAGTAFFDDQAAPGTRYKYRVDYYENSARKNSLTTQEVTFPGRFDIQAPEFHSRQASHRSIYIDWSVASDPTLYTFRVYRRQNMAGKFKKVDVYKGFYNRGDSLFLVVKDTAVRPRTVYEYSIEPLDRLGNPGTASARCGVSSFAGDDVPVIRRLDVNTGKDDHSVVLTWKFDHTDLVRSIGIFRSDEYDSGYVKIAEVPAADTVFNDHVTGAMENYYYYLVLQGIMDKSFPSARVGGHSYNSEVPGPPSDVAAKPVKGGVMVYWNHLDPDVTGYYIYRDMGLNDSLQQISGLIKPDREIMSYTDTSGSLSGNRTYRYALRAVNDSYLMSKLSDVVSAQPQLTADVVSPSNLRGGYSDGQILLVWDNMNTTDANLLGYNIYRKETGNGTFSRINQDMLLFNTNTYTDSSELNGTSYEYAVTTVNEAGNESPRSKSLTVKVPVRGSMADPPSGFRVSHGRGSVVLSWTGVGDDNLDRYAIYRYLPGSQPQLLAKVRPDNYSYEDNTAEPGRLYFYYMTAISRSGRESAPCRTVSIRF